MFALAALLSACANTGQYYDEDGPGSRAANEFVNAPDAIPRDEPVVKNSTRPYTVFGQRYYPLQQRQPVRQTGQASWYGKQFHGRPTSIGETYDMYAMTAAHPTLPLPSYVRVTNPANQRQVVVRVNDRGPFLDDRIIDLSFAAAAKLGFIEQGTARVVMEVVDPVVVTLQQLRKRRGLSPTATPAQLAAAAKSDQQAVPLQAAARLPVIAPSQPVKDVPPVDRAPADERGSGSTNANPIPVTASLGKSAGVAVRADQGVPLPPILLPAGNNRDDAVMIAGPERINPETLKATPQVIEARRLSVRKNRQVADVFIPPDIDNNEPLPLPVGPPPVVLVEPFEGKGLRRAVPERIRSKKASSSRTSKRGDTRKKEPVFVVPYKDRLPKVAKTKEKPARVYLQLGAYETEKSARVALTEATVSLAWLKRPVAIIADRGRHKLQAGPFPTARVAQRAARRIRSDSSFSPFYVFR